jgi:flagellar protein FliL
MKILLIVLIVLVIAVPAGLYFGGFLNAGDKAASSEESAHGEGGGEEEAAAEGGHGDAGAAPTYLTLDPPFVVNFTHRGTLRYLQVSLDLSYDKPALLEKVKAKMPAVRNDLIMLFSNQDYEVLSTASGKEHLRQEILKAINHIIEVEPKEGEEVGQVYITNFVMQ